MQKQSWECTSVQKGARMIYKGLFPHVSVCAWNPLEEEDGTSELVEPLLLSSVLQQVCYENHGTKEYFCLLDYFDFKMVSKIHCRSHPVLQFWIHNFERLS